MWCNLILLISANINLVDSVSVIAWLLSLQLQPNFHYHNLRLQVFLCNLQSPGGLWLSSCVTPENIVLKSWQSLPASWELPRCECLSCLPELTWILSTFASLDEAEDEQDEQQQHNRTHDTDEPALRRKAWLHLRHAFRGNKEQKKGCMVFVWGAGGELFRKKRKE